MSSHGFCSQCSRELVVESADGLCPACRVGTAGLGTTPLDSPPAPADPDATGSADGPLLLHDLPLPDQPDSLASSTGVFPALPAGLPTGTPLPRPAYLPLSPAGYALIRELGDGGMGTVYLARHLPTRQLVAVKFLNKPGAPGAFERFLIEVEALARLNRPDIVQVRQVEPNWHPPYFSMEYVRGGTLADLVQKGLPPVPCQTAARLIWDAAVAVEAAHAAKVVHRDLKPSNILLEVERYRAGDRTDPAPTAVGPADLPAARVKVSDFGLAKRTDEDEGLTRTGPIGTPAYMSPEAAAGRVAEVGVPADVYGLGATLYHLLTGRPPFEGNAAETIRQVIADEPARVRAVRPEVPPDLEAIVVRAMDKAPDRRYASATELADDLGRFLQGLPVKARRLTPWRRAGRWAGRNRRRLAAAAGAVLVAAGVFYAGHLFFGGNAVVADPSDPLAETEAGLAAGRRVQVIGQTGLPRWHDWVLTPSTLARSPTNDGAATFTTEGHTLLELLRDPMTDRYRVTADLRHVRGYPASPGTQRPMSDVGFYFGRTEVQLPRGWRTDLLFGVVFTDCARVPVPGQEPDEPAAQFGEAVYGGRADQLPSRTWVGRPGKAPFDPLPGPEWPAKWRRVSVEVGTDEVRAWWLPHPENPEDRDAPPRLIHETTGDAARARYAGLSAKLRKYAPEYAGTPAWHPRLPLGVIAQRGTVSVRNVVVEPLPPRP